MVEKKLINCFAYLKIGNIVSLIFFFFFFSQTDTPFSNTYYLINCCHASESDSESPSSERLKVGVIFSTTDRLLFSSLFDTAVLNHNCLSYRLEVKFIYNY